MYRVVKNTCDLTVFPISVNSEIRRTYAQSYRILPAEQYNLWMEGATYHTHGYQVPSDAACTGTMCAVH